MIRYDREVEFKFDEYEDGKKLILIGPNDSGKSNVSRALRWMVQEIRSYAYRTPGVTGFQNNSGLLSKYPSVAVKMQISYKDCEEIARRILEDYFMTIKGRFTDSAIWIWVHHFVIGLTEELANHFSDIELNTTDRLLSLYRDTFCEFQEYIRQALCLNTSFGFIEVSEDYMTLVILRRIAILTQDRGLYELDQLDIFGIVNYQNTLKQLLKYRSWYGSEENNMEFQKINEQLLILTNYTIDIPYTILNFIDDLMKERDSGRKKIITTKLPLCTVLNSAISLLQLTKTKKDGYDMREVQDLLKNTSFDKNLIKTEISTHFGVDVDCNTWECTKY